jgi:hypothetical protein
VKIVYVVVVVCFLLLHTSHTRNRGMRYTIKYDMVEDGLIEHASEGNREGGGGKEANLTLLCNQGNVGRNG